MWCDIADASGVWLNVTQAFLPNQNENQHTGKNRSLPSTAMTSTSTTWQLMPFALPLLSSLRISHLISISRAPLACCHLYPVVPADCKVTFVGVARCRWTHSNNFIRMSSTDIIDLWQSDLWVAVLIPWLMSTSLLHCWSVTCYTSCRMIVRRQHVDSRVVANLNN